MKNNYQYKSLARVLIQGVQDNATDTLEEQQIYGLLQSMLAEVMQRRSAVADEQKSMVLLQRRAQQDGVTLLGYRTAYATLVSRPVGQITDKEILENPLVWNGTTPTFPTALSAPSTPEVK